MFLADTSAPLLAIIFANLYQFDNNLFSAPSLHLVACVHSEKYNGTMEPLSMCVFCNSKKSITT